MSFSGSARGRVVALTELPTSLREGTAVGKGGRRHLRPRGCAGRCLLVMRRGFGRAGDRSRRGLDRVVAVNWAVGSWGGWGSSGPAWCGSDSAAAKRFHQELPQMAL